MKAIIHNIRKQPEEVRRHILHVSTAIFAVILILVWVYSLGVNFTSSNTQAKISQDLKPFSAIKDNIEGGYNSITQPNSTQNPNSSTDPNADLRAQENSL